jgi:hypothetical protein
MPAMTIFAQPRDLSPLAMMLPVKDDVGAALISSATATERALGPPTIRVEEIASENTPPGRSFVRVCGLVRLA